MKRLVTGRAGALVVYGRENITDEELKRRTDQISDRRAGAIRSAIEGDFSSYNVTRIMDDESQTGDARVDELDFLGLDVARSYGVAYESLAMPANEATAIYVLADMNMKIDIEASRQARRESLTSILRRMGFRPKE